MSSSYRFSAAFVVRLSGAALAALGLLLLLLVVLVWALSLPVDVVVAGVAAAAVLLLALGWAARRGAEVVRFDDTGYRVRYIRGAGVRQAEWKQVEDVVTTTSAGTACVVVRLRDGRTTTVPVGVLAGRPDAFVDDLRAHLNRGHGYRRLSAPQG